MMRRFFPSTIRGGDLPFVFEINTANTSTGSTTNTQFRLPLISIGTYDFDVDWGDSTSDNITVWNVGNTHTYGATGTYTITITGTCLGWAFVNTGDRLKILNVTSWGIDLGELANGFYGCANLSSVAEGIISTGTSFAAIFRNCSSLTSVPSGLFASADNVTTMASAMTQTSITSIPSGLFDNLTAVTTFSTCFDACSSLTGALPSGLFDNNILVTIFLRCFRNTNITSLPSGLFDNCPLITNFQETFQNCNLTSLPSGLFANQTALTTISICFSGNDITSIPSGLFNSTTLLVTLTNSFDANDLTTVPANLFDNLPNNAGFSAMFRNNLITSIPADLFRFQTVSTVFTNIFLGNTINTTDYSNMLVSLNTYNANNATFHGGSSQYNVTGQTARTNLTAIKGWSITDGGLE